MIVLGLGIGGAAGVRIGSCVDVGIGMAELPILVLVLCWYLCLLLWCWHLYWLVLAFVLAKALVLAFVLIVVLVSTVLGTGVILVLALVFMLVLPSVCGHVAAFKTNLCLVTLCLLVFVRTMPSRKFQRRIGLQGFTMNLQTLVKSNTVLVISSLENELAFVLKK